MPLSFKPALIETLRLVRGFSWIRWAQIAACVIVAGVGIRALEHASQPDTLQRDAAQSDAAAADAAAADAVPADGAQAVAGQSAAAPTDMAHADASSASSGPPASERSISGAPRPADSAAPLIVGQSTLDVIVGRNDTLDHIFRKLKLSLADLATLRTMPGIKTHLDNLRTGESLHLTYRDTELDGLERRLNENETLQVVRDANGLRAKVLQNPLDSRTRTIRGTIDHSLFEAVTAAGAHDQTAVNLADIFGWDIDFVLDIQRGDSFVVTYQELFQKGVYIKDGPVLAAAFVNQGRRYQAVRYTDPQGAARYFTPEGRSMHKAFLRAPVEFTRVSSRFNTARLHPILNMIRAHKGIDYAAPIGTPVRAAGDGRVSFAGPKGGYGNVVELEHSRSIMTVYGHLSRFAKGTRVGEHVTQGTIIAYVGMTGLATGPHLHYEYRVNGVFKNPQTVPLPDAAPIDARLREDFLARTAPLLATLESPGGPTLVAR